MTIQPILDIQSRIASIQHRFAPGPAVASGGSPAVGGASTLTASTSGTFASDLTKATGQAAVGGAASSISSARLSGSPAGGSPPSTGAEVVALSKKYLGVPYVWGGTNPATGLDCSGLTKLVYSRLGIDLPRVSWQQAKAGRAVDGMDDAKAGDLIFFGRPTHHVGIYIGDGKMVHAPRPGKVVEISSVYEKPSAIRRVLPEPVSPSFAAVEPTAATRPQASRALAAFAGPLPAGTPYAAEFRNAEARTGVPARVLAALAKVESGYRADAVSPVGARGLMQFMRGTARELGVDPLDPASAIDGAARLLKRHVKEFGSLELALAAYNAGQGSVRKYGGIPPFAETRGHVSKVMTILRGSTR
jgi:cell wall-associated NlpC family hydrolase